jgi:protein ImuB
VTAIMEGQRRVIVSIDEAADRLGLACGMTITHTQSLVPDLHVVNATLDDDAAGWSPRALVHHVFAFGYADPPDGVFIDVAGSAHLFQGEASLLEDLCKRLKAAGIASKAAVADTPGCAWALARYGDTTIVSPGRTSEAIASLPIASLRLSKEGRPATCHCLNIAGRLELKKLLPVCESGRSF